MLFEGGIMFLLILSLFIINGAKARNRELWNRELVTDEQVMKQWIENRFFTTLVFSSLSSIIPLIGAGSILTPWQ